MKEVKRLRIVFMGTPDFAVASLDAICKAGYNVIAVITAPDKPSGRGMKITESAVKKYAGEHNLNILQPLKLKDPHFLDELRSLNADLQIVVAFRMLPEVVWNMPPMGTVNLHGSLLPQYRGAAPINWAIIYGEKETGVTTFKLKQEIDTGDILIQEKIPVGGDETFGEVHDRMKEIGAGVLVRTIDGLVNGSLQEIPQSAIATENLRSAPKIFTDHCRINWSASVQDIHNPVRGLSPSPGAFTSLQGKMFKIFRSEIETGDIAEIAGSFKSDGKTFLKFACKDGYLLVKELQIEGKKKMGIEDFLRGNKVNV
jgi:methionyl-tRNA formyltransferase